jgi:hypothetical protein
MKFCEDRTARVSTVWHEKLIIQKEEQNDLNAVSHQRVVEDEFEETGCCTF